MISNPSIQTQPEASLNKWFGAVGLQIHLFCLNKHKDFKPDLPFLVTSWVFYGFDIYYNLESPRMISSDTLLTSKYNPRKTMTYCLPLQ